MAMSCDKPVESFSLLPVQSSFVQSTQYVQRPIDVLWVVDSSGSMASSQQNLSNNFAQFIQEFQTKGFDFNMSVTHSGAFIDNYYGTLTRSRLCDGPITSSNNICNQTGAQWTGIEVMTANTPNLQSVFQNNIQVGIVGTGDERAFSSMKKALENTNNTGFRRAGAFLSVIIVSDEDDFSHTDWQNGINSYYFTENYNDPNILSIQHFKDFLTTLTGSTPETAADNFAVHTISIKDSTCLAALGDSSQKISQRYQQLATATGGISSSLCDPMSEVLESLSQKTIELASIFQLDREPIPNTISVTVNGAGVPENTTCGWSYSSTPTTWTIRFHGSACIPPAGADVKVYFEPATPQI